MSAFAIDMDYMSDEDDSTVCDGVDFDELARTDCQRDWMIRQSKEGFIQWLRKKTTQQLVREEWDQRLCLYDYPSEAISPLIRVLLGRKDLPFRVKREIDTFYLYREL
jgi:hypothetical protein